MSGYRARGPPLRRPSSGFGPSSADANVTRLRTRGKEPTVASKEHRYDGYCRVATQAVCGGKLDSRVQAVAAPAARNGTAHIVVRVDRILIYVEDWDALDSFTDAWQRAVELAEKVFPPRRDAFYYAEQRARQRHREGTTRPPLGVSTSTPGRSSERPVTLSQWTFSTDNLWMRADTNWRCNYATKSAY